MSSITGDDKPRPRITPPVTPHRPLPKTPDFPALEQQVLERWRERDIFRESVRRRQGAEEFVFYEGPPTANGRPGSHHVLARVFKDIFPRYQTMLGKYVERKGGWDCHGLPVEIAVEQKLGFKTKHDIERYGIAEFNQQCRESVFEFLEDWDALTERIGYWVDIEHPYRTLDTTYIESVWWALKTMWERELLFEGHRVVPYCVRCGTALSSHEVAQGYEDVEDPSIYVTFPVTEPVGPLRAGDRLLAWTTTPWTVLSHAALAVAPDLTYVRTEDGYVLAEARVEAVLGEDARRRRALPRAARSSAPATSRRSTSSRPRSSGRRATPCCRATSSAPTTAPASCTPRSPSARTTTGSARSRASTSSTRCGSTAPTSTAWVPTPGAGSRRPTPTSSRTCARAGACCAPRPTCTPTRTAGAAGRRSSTTPSRRGSSAPRSCATACWPPTRPSTGTRSTSSTAAWGAGWRTTSTGRSRASATGARRCRCGAARTATPSASGRWPSWRRSRATCSRIRTGRSSTRRRGTAPTAASRCSACPR